MANRYSKFYTVRPICLAPSTYVVAWTLKEAMEKFVDSRRPFISVKVELKADAEGTEFYALTLGDGSDYVVFETPKEEVRAYLDGE